MKIKTLKMILSLAAGIFFLPACGFITDDKNGAMSTEELKFYLLGQEYYERELHCSYYPKDCPSKGAEDTIIDQANDPKDKEKQPIIAPADPKEKEPVVAPAADPNKIIAYGFDTDKDGFIDTVAVDTDGDGRADKVLYVDKDNKIKVGTPVVATKCGVLASDQDDLMLLADSEEDALTVCGVTADKPADKKDGDKAKDDDKSGGAETQPSGTDKPTDTKGDK